MDKSEGKDFISKTLSSITETVSKFYHTGNTKLSLAALKKHRNEKIAVLGNRVLELLKQNQPLTEKNLEMEYKSILDIERQIETVEQDLDKLQKAKPSQSAAPTPKKAAKPADTKPKRTTAKKTDNSAKPAAKNTAKKAGAPKTGTPKKAVPKKPAAQEPAKDLTVDTDIAGNVVVREDDHRQ